jgi:hypothetical protein
MYIRFVVAIVLIGLGYGVSLLPEHFREQGDARTELVWKKKLDAAVLVEELRVSGIYAKKELENEKRFNTLQNNFKDEIAIVRSKYASSELRFNRTKICAKQTTGSAEGEDPSGVHETVTTPELFPEPYGGNIKKLMLEADLFIAGYRQLQEAVKKSSCMVVVPEQN